MASKMDSYNWAPLDSKTPYKLQLGEYGLIILNTPIVLVPEEMLALWNGASIRSTVDGGTTKWFNFVDKHGLSLKNKFPDIVTGDFDSISPNLLKTCEENGVYVEKTPDQNFTDFHKAISVLKNRYGEKLDSLLVIIGNSGRLDHTFSNLDTLYRVFSIFPGQKITAYLMTSSSLTWILQPGYHTITIPQYLRQREEWCGILPFSSVKNSITTTGLRWNLDNDSVEFGGLISSSNTYDDSPEVTINTNAHIIWTMGLGRDS